MKFTPRGSFPKKRVFFGVPIKRKWGLVYFGEIKMKDVGSFNQTN